VQGPQLGLERAAPHEFLMLRPGPAVTSSATKAGDLRLDTLAGWTVCFQPLECRALLRGRALCLNNRA